MVEHTLAAAREADLPVLLPLVREFWSGEGYPWDEAVARAAEALVRVPERGRVWLVIVDGAAVGYVAVTFGWSLEWHGRDAFVDEMYLRLGVRGHGLGTAVMVEIEAACAALGVRALHLEVERGNRAGRALWSRRGFAGSDRRLLTKRLAGAARPAAGLPFAKLHGAGNAYVVVDGRDDSRDWPALAVAMSRPATGIGSDGLAVVTPPSGPGPAQVRMRIFNPDGSEAEMSGNGIRLFAKFVLDRGIARPGPGGLVVETEGGPRTVTPFLEDGRMVGGRVAMGVPAVEQRDERLEVEGQALQLTILSLGNPHAVVLLDGPVDDFPLGRIGPALERHPRFPNRTNVEIVNVVDRGHLHARVFERGAGETASSGTGATASAVAARMHGLTDGVVEVALPGGMLRVAWDGTGEATLEGPSVEICSGVWPI